MLTDIVTALGLGDKYTNEQFIIATKDNISDLNFVFSEILSFYIKRNYSVILLNFAQSSNHYSHLLLKSGINVRQLRDQQSYVIIDALSELEKITNSSLCTSAMFGTLFQDNLGIDCLKDLYLYLQKSVELVKSVDPCKHCVIFIDEISVLSNLGVNLNAIEPFVQYCRDLCTNTVPTPNILLIGSAHDEHDLQNNKLVNFLLHLSNIRIVVKGLKTGYSKDAHGKITICTDNKMGCVSRHQKLLFKVTEKGAKLFTLGL